MTAGAGPVPADHDCEECGCIFPEHGWHHSKLGLCLACGGCGDPECCGGHDDSCRFEKRSEDDRS